MPKILIVEDEPDILMVMKQALEDEGFVVLTAVDSPSARRLLDSEVPDCVVTDLIMPGESGFSLISYMRKSKFHDKIPVVVTSVMEAETEASKLGADAYLTKPFQSKELVDLVTRITSGTGR